MHSLESTRQSSWLGWFFRGLLFLAFAILVGKLIELQLIKGNYFQALANDNRIRRIVIKAPRGEIKTVDSETIAKNIEIKKKIIFDPKEGYKKTEDIDNATPDELVSDWGRTYPYGADFAHVTGYVTEVGEDEVGKINPDCPDRGPYKLGDFIGRGGIEEKYECELRGIDGEQLIEVNSMGKRERVLGTKEPVPGKNIALTIDAGLQRKTALSMDSKKGAAIITDGLGNILTLYSSPSYDPNIFIKKDSLSLKQRADALTSPDLLLFNRAVSGAYHPGSIFKIVTSIAALSEKKIDENFQYDDKGVIKIGDFSYYNWYFTQNGGVEGLIDLTRAIARSTDTFFYKVGEMVGVEKLAEWSRKFGLGSKTHIDIPGEVSGLIPDPAWKRQVKGELWFLGNTYHMAIGQGDVTTTPLQGNLIASVIANDGRICTPHLAQKDSECRDLNIDINYLNLVKKGMEGACSKGGTGYPFFDFTPQVLCKTGTAETEEVDKTHAWFNVIAHKKEDENNKIVTTILIEKGGEGSQVAAPIARKILDYWIARP